MPAPVFVMMYYGPVPLLRSELLQRGDTSLQVEVRKVVAAVLTDRRNEQLPIDPKTKKKILPEPIDPDEIQLFAHSTFEPKHHINPDLLLRIDGVDVQTTRDSAVGPEIRRRLQEVIPEGTTIQVWLI